jgi:hypothetical protein
MTPDATIPQARGPAPHLCVCGMAGALLRLALVVAAVLGVLAGAAELGLRAGGATPRVAAGLSNVVPDGWTGFRLRPGVSSPEWEVTNDLGMHAPRSYTVARTRRVLRVAVLGSSVVYGLGTHFADTIPMAIERELKATGHRAEVLNFGTHSFSIVNVSALLQAYVHQFQPDVVVVVIDLQVGYPRWPAVRPVAAPPDEGIRKLNWWEALLKRGSERSALLAVLDDPRPARKWIRRVSALPLDPPVPAAPRRRPGARAQAGPSPVPAPAGNPTAASSPEKIRAYEERRERELAAPLAAMAAFCAEQSIALYFVTPYGPYFDFTDDELARMSVHHFLVDAARVHGSERAALSAEIELITRVVHRVAAGGSARVIDMLEASRRSSIRTSRDFTDDGVHLSVKGNLAFGRLIATRIRRDVDRPARGQD